MFTHCREISDAAVKASYLIANEIAVASKPFSECEFVKTCMLKAVEIVCPVKRQAFANISLTRNTVANRISDVSVDLDNQLKRKVNMKRFKEKITGRLREFEQRFQIFSELEKNFFARHSP